MEAIEPFIRQSPYLWLTGIELYIPDLPQALSLFICFIRHRFRQKLHHCEMLAADGCLMVHSSILVLINFEITERQVAVCRGNSLMFAMFISEIVS